MKRQITITHRHGATSCSPSTPMRREIRVRCHRTFASPSSSLVGRRGAADLVAPCGVTPMATTAIADLGANWVHTPQFGTFHHSQRWRFAP